MTTRRPGGRGAVFRKPTSHEWETPRRLFDELQREFAFTVDGAALEHNARLPRFWTLVEPDGLLTPWAGERVFVNPPYGSAELSRWVRKAARERDRGCPLSVLLVPVRCETQWWHDVVLAQDGPEVRYFRGRLRFELRGVPAESTASFPACLLIFRTRGGVMRYKLPPKSVSAARSWSCEGSALRHAA